MPSHEEAIHKAYLTLLVLDDPISNFIAAVESVLVRYLHATL
jgi:hypothetical protein